MRILNRVGKAALGTLVLALALTSTARGQDVGDTVEVHGVLGITQVDGLFEGRGEGNSPVGSLTLRPATPSPFIDADGTVTCMDVDGGGGPNTAVVGYRIDRGTFLGSDVTGQGVIAWLDEDPLTSIRWKFLPAPPTDCPDSALGPDAITGGFSDNGPATITITDAPPRPVILTGPDRYTASTDATFTFTSFGTGSTRCRITGGTFFTPCGSPKTYASLPDGSYFFEFKARRASGPWVKSPRYRWTVDTADPVLSFQRSPGALTNTNSPVFTIAPTLGIVDRQCQLDDHGFSPCEARNKLGPLSDGPHTFEVKATDRAGNPSNRLSSTFTVDTGS